MIKTNVTVQAGSQSSACVVKWEKFLSMPEMPHAGNHHCKIVLHAIVNTVLISYRTAGLDERLYAFRMRHLNTIIKRKERIAR